MAIRTKRYTFKAKEYQEVFQVRAIQITEKNLTDIVAYICRNGGAATGHLSRPQYKRPARIRIKQRNFGFNWSKQDWRVAKLGDYILRHDNGDFERVKESVFEQHFEAVK